MCFFHGMYIGKLIFGMLQVGLNVTNVARQFCCSRLAIHNLRNKFYVSGSVRDLPRSSHSHVTKLPEDQMITLTHQGNWSLPATVAARLLKFIHRRLFIVLERNLALYKPIGCNDMIEILLKLA